MLIQRDIELEIPPLISGALQLNLQGVLLISVHLVIIKS